MAQLLVSKGEEVFSSEISQSFSLKLYSKISLIEKGRFAGQSEPL